MIGNPQPTSGYSIKTTQLTYSKDGLSFYFEEMSPGPREATEDAEAVPFEILNIHKGDLLRLGDSIYVLTQTGCSGPAALTPFNGTGGAASERAEELFERLQGS